MGRQTQADDATDAQHMTVAELSDEDTDTLHSLYAAARHRAADMEASQDHRLVGYRTARNIEEELADRGISTEEVRSRYEEGSDR